MKKIYKGIFYLIISIFIITVLLGLLLLFTPWGLQFSLNHSNKILPGTLTVKSLSGNLGHHFVLNGVHYQHDSMNLDVKRLDVHWNIFYLFQKKYYIQNIHAEGVECHLTPKDKSNKFELSQWFDQYHIQNLELKDFKLYYQNKLTTVVTRATLQYKQADYLFNIQLPKGVIEGTGFITNRPYWTWHAEVKSLNIDSNFIWNGTNSHVSFNFITKGKWKPNNHQASFLFPMLTGNVHGYPLSGTIKILDDDDKTIFDKIDLTIGKARIFVNGEAFKNWDLTWQITLPNLYNINTALTGSFLSSGYVKTINTLPFIEGKITGKNIKFAEYFVQSLEGNIHSKIETNTLFGTFNFNNIKLNDYLIPLLHVETISKLSSDVIQHKLSLYFSPVNTLIGNLSTPNFLTGKNTNNLQGKFILQFNDLSKIVFPSFIQSFHGYLQGQIEVQGPINGLKYLGYIDLKNGQFTIPTLELHPSAQIHAAFNNNLIANITSQIKSGAGHGTITGTVDINKAGHPIKLSIKGNNLSVSHTKKYQITASPNLDLTIEGENVNITGSVSLPYVKIITASYSQIIELPSEFEFAHQEKAGNYFNNLALHFKLEVGNNAYIVYQNLRAHIKGSLSVFQIPGGLPSGNGTLFITKGSYQIYNRMFSIHDGRLIYAGNLLSNPGLAIRAMRASEFPQTNFLGFTRASDTDKMKVGILVTGTLHHPITELISEPKMSQDDILSYMVFGQSHSSISGLNALSLLGSLTSELNINGPTVGDENTSENSFSEVSSIDIFNPIEALNFAIPISKHWRIQTETTLNETGADLLYNYERS